MRHETALKLIDRIYETVLDRAALPAVLVELGEATGCVQECLCTETPGRDSFAMMAPRRDPVFVEAFRGHWAENSHGWKILRRALLAAPPMATGDVRWMIDSRGFGRSDFFRSWWREQNLGWSTMVVRFPTRHGMWGFYGVHKPMSNDTFDNDEIALFQTVAPHLARAISLQDELASLALEEELTAVDSSGTKAIILADVAGRVLFANGLAKALLEREDGIKVEAGSLTPSDPQSAATFRWLLASCADPGRAEDGPGGSLTLPRGDAYVPMKVDVVPFGARTKHRHFYFLGVLRPTALLVITEPEQERAARKRDLEARFGLTPAEAGFALEIVRGGGRAAAAARLGISLSTARMHLSRIFHKTGVSRQAELVRLLSLSHCDCRETAMPLTGNLGDQVGTF